MRVIGTLAVLAAAAFALGAGAGLLWKDPGLLMAQWMGGTQEVAWSADATHSPEEILGSDSGPLPAVEVPSREPAKTARVAAPTRTAAAEPARPPAATRPASPPAALQEDEDARGPATPAVSAPPPAAAAAAKSGVAVQVGAFGERRSADQLIARLRKVGYPAYASAADGGAWRVRVGPFRDRGAAEQAAARLKRDQKLPTWVLEETGGR